MSVDGGLDYSLRQMLFGMFNNRNNTLSVNNWLNFINNISDQGLLYNRRAFKYSSCWGGRCFLNVLLDMVNNVPVYFSMDDGLNLNNPVISDCFLNNWGYKCCCLVDIGIASKLSLLGLLGLLGLLDVGLLAGLLVFMMLME